MFKLSKSKNINFLGLYHNVRGIYDEIPPVRKRKRVKNITSVLKYINISLLIFFVISISFSLFIFLSIKSVYIESIYVANNMDLSVSAIREGEYDRALDISKKISEHLINILDNIDEYNNNFLTKNSTYFANQVRDAYYLTSSIKTLNEAIYKVSVLGINIRASIDENSSDTKFSKNNLLKIIYESEPELNGVIADINLSLDNLKRANFSGPFLIFKDSFVESESEINKLEQYISNIIPMSKISVNLLGYPRQTNYLFVFRNEDTFSSFDSQPINVLSLQIENGEIMSSDVVVINIFSTTTKSKISESIDYKMAANDWPADWPQLALKIENAYREGVLKKYGDLGMLLPEKFDGIISVNPEYLKDLTNLFGVIEVDGKIFNESIFFGDTSSSTQLIEKAGNILAKKIDDIFFEGELSFENFKSITNYNLNKKNIILYLNDDSTQLAAREMGWTGEIYSEKGDYIMLDDVVLSDKNADIKRRISYKVDESVSGLFSDLNIFYSNNNKKEDSIANKVFTRIYVPLGSVLVNGADFKENMLVVYNEFDKTVFAINTVIEPENIGGFRLYYKLPADINNNLINNKFYSLNIQKKPDINIDDFMVDLTFINDIRSYQPTGFNVSKVGGNKVIWSNDLSADRRYEINTK